MLRHWSQFVPNMSTNIRGHEALHRHHHHQCCFTPTETVRIIRDGEHRTPTLTFTQLLNSHVPLVDDNV